MEWSDPLILISVVPSQLVPHCVPVAEGDGTGRNLTTGGAQADLNLGGRGGAVGADGVSSDSVPNVTVPPVS